MVGAVTAGLGPHARGLRAHPPTARACARPALPQPSALLRRHRLKLLTTSKVCELRLREAAPNPADALVLGDAMAADPALVAEAQDEAGAGGEDDPAMAALARVEPLSTVDLSAAASGAAPASSSSTSIAKAGAEGGAVVAAQQPSPVDRVAASLASAAAAASSAAQGVYTAAVPYAGGRAAGWCGVSVPRPVPGQAA